MALVLLVAGCAGDSRPTPEEWQPLWQVVTSLMPTAEDLGDPPDRATCSTALGEMRSVSADLFPTPDAAIEPIVREWVRVAEDALFECPPSSAALPDLSSAFAELLRLEAEVNVVLEIDSEE